MNEIHQALTKNNKMGLIIFIVINIFTFYRKSNYRYEYIKKKYYAVLALVTSLVLVTSLELVLINITN